MAVYKKSNSGFLPFIQEEAVTAPFTDIKNRAKVSAALKVVAPSERIMVNSLKLMSNEFGPNGEKVYEPDNRDTRVRFVGQVSVTYGAGGTNANLLVNSDSYCEVTFYGTGLHVLQRIHTTTISFEASVDGAGFTTVFDGSNQSSDLAGINTKPLQITPIVKGLALGWHTVKIRRDTDTPSINGFEILNESAQLTVRSGKAHGNGYEYILDSDQLIDYNLGFDNIADLDVGTRGGRVVVYIDPTDGTIKKRLRKVGDTSQFTINVDHTNEAAYRRIAYNEFGRRRGDDFSTLTSTNNDKYFTLDDNSTNLIGENIRELENSLFIDNSAGFNVTITFVGTGLDIYYDNLTGGAKALESVRVDGTQVDTQLSQPANAQGIVEICSNLPYGTHVVKFTGDTSFNGVINDFIVYQPKRPDLPEGAVVLADYNLVADYIVASTFGQETISTGVIRKDCLREFILAGSTQWATDAAFDANKYIAGPQLFEANTGTARLEYTFTGTGFDIRHKAFSTYNNNIQIRLNGLPLTAANFPTATFSDFGYDTGFNSSTGVLNMQSAASNIGAGFSCSGLPLGTYTFEMDKNGTTSTMSIEAFDIHMPIHSPHVGFGSRYVKDCRNFDSLKDVNKKIKKTEITASFNTVENVVHDSKGITQWYDNGTGRVFVYFEEPFANIDYDSLAITDSDNSVSTALDPSSSSTQRLKNAAEFTNRNLAGAPEDERRVTVKITGTTNKDELEE